MRESCGVPAEICPFKRLTDLVPAHFKCRYGKISRRVDGWRIAIRTLREFEHGDPDSQESKIVRVRSSWLSEISEDVTAREIKPNTGDYDRSLTYNRIAMGREKVDLSPTDVFPVRGPQRKDTVAWRKVVKSATPEETYHEPLAEPR